MTVIIRQLSDIKALLGEILSELQRINQTPPTPEAYGFSVMADAPGPEHSTREPDDA